MTDLSSILTRKRFNLKKSWTEKSCRLDRKGNIIQFKMSFDEWVEVWTSSGFAHLLGRGKGKYCLSRYNDIGHYEVGNVFVQPFVENVRQAQLGNTNTRGTIRGPRTDAEKAAISAACKGRKSPNAGKTLTPEHRAALSKAMKGNKNAVSK